jgi:hypothetical protein
MSRVVRYTCRHEFWPVLEATLASHGYSVDIPLQQSGSGARAMVMRHGDVSLLFTQVPTSDLLNVEIWGKARDTAIQLLASLPLRLSRPLVLLERTV